MNESRLKRVTSRWRFVVLRVNELNQRGEKCLLLRRPLRGVGSLSCERTVERGLVWPGEAENSFSDGTGLESGLEEQGTFTQLGEKSPEFVQVTRQRLEGWVAVSMVFPRCWDTGYWKVATSLCVREERDISLSWRKLSCEGKERCGAFI